MRKTNFFTLIDRGNGAEAVQVQGYTDPSGAKIFYYRTGGAAQYAWAAVHTETGLALCYASSRIGAIRKTRDPLLQSRLCAVLDSEKGTEMRSRYINAVIKATNTPAALQ